jgi:hypothetical protein
MHNTEAGLRRTLVLAAALLLAAGAGRAQTVDVQPLLLQHDVTALQEVGGTVFAGLDGGGVLVVPAGDLAGGTVWHAGSDLSGNNVTDLAWTGEHLWIATSGGGLTRVTDPAGTPAFRQFIGTNVGSQDLTAVTGAMVSGSERVYYAMDGAGIGQIVDGISGNLYTAEQDGLVSNTVNALQIWQGQLFVGTPAGVSRFVGNVFTTQNAGLADLVVNDFAVDSADNLLAATNGGIYRWDNAGATWVHVHGLGSWVTRISCRQDEIWALGIDSQGNGVVHAATGGSWRVVTLLNPKCRSILAGNDVWIGGRTVATSGSRVLEHAYLGLRGTGDQFTLRAFDASIVRSSEGVTFGAGGQPWIGDWTGNGLSRRDADGSWHHLWESANVAADSNGIFTAGGNVLGMATGADGTVWAAQYTMGILRLDGTTGKVNHLTPASTGGGLRAGSVVNLATHPDGPLIVMHDWADTEKVEICADPAHWRNPANWLVLPRDGGLGAGPTVWDAVVERNDVVWFAVEGIGLVRWDINGDAAGPEDTLTWLDQSDDRWDAPLTSVSGTSLDLRLAVALALGRDGTLWAGGNGAVQFTYDASTRHATLVTSVTEKFAATSEGLINGSVVDLAVDANGDVWVASRTGLNRLRGSGDNLSITAWTDLANYYGSTTYQVLYSANVIAPLPGLTYRKLAVDPTGRHLLLSADQGAALLTVGGGGGGEVDVSALAGAYCYPNPWLSATGAQTWLKLGGLPAGVTADDPALVEIYDLQGELVYRDDQVAAETAFWNGTNRMGNLVRTGLYVVRLSWRGQDAVLGLSVVR